MAGKPIDSAMLAELLSGKRKIGEPAKKPKPEDTPVIFDFERERPEWHKWVYGGVRNPTI